MAFFDWVQFLRSNPNSRAKVSRKQSQTGSRPSLEALEDRLLFAVLPVALVNNPTTIATGFSPSMVQDPSNPQNLVEFHAGSNGLLIGNYSADGGQTWKTSVNDPAVTPAPFQNITDPNLATSGNQGSPPKFAMVTNVTVAWDRGENIYVTEIQRDATNNSGALVFERYSVNTNGSGTMTGLSQVTTNKVLERWLGTDPILNPVVAVDNNLTTYTDATASPNTTQTDSMATLIADPNHAGVQMAKAVYVAWNTNHTAPANVPSNFTPNVIKVAASSDGGANFTTPQFVNNGGNIEAPILPNRPAVAKDAAPQIVFTQGSADGKVAGGQLVFVWNDFANNKVMLDASQPDNGVATTKVADSYTFNPSAAFGVSSVSVSSGGTGYVVGDLVTLQTSPAGSTPAEFLVTSVNGVNGAITGLSIYQGGVYGSQSFLPNPVTGGTGSGATVTASFLQVKYATTAKLTAGSAGSGYAVGDTLYANGGTVTQATPTASQTQITVTKINVGATAATLVAGGSGYKVGDVLTVQGGGGVGAVATQITVNTVNAGGTILTYTLSGAGSYDSANTPANSVSVTDPTPSASGAKFDLSFQTVTAAAVSTGGSGYLVGDVLTVVGGVGTATQLTVTAVDSSGAVTAVSITTPGGYTTQPVNPVDVTDGTVGSTASGAKFNLTTGLRGAISAFTLANPGSYTVTPPTFGGNQVVEEEATATVAVGGTGYKVNDLLDVVGGTGTATRLKVTSVTAGAITGFSIVQVGQYTSVPPSMPVSVTDITTGTATGALINLTYTSSGTGAKFDFTFATSAGTGPIADAVANAAGGPDIPGISIYSVPVNISDPKFVVGDLEVTVAITHPHLNQLRLVLTSPSGTTINLLNNAIDGAGNATNQGIADQANLGVVNVDRNNNFNSVIGTVFDQLAPRAINDGTAATPYTAHFRPESGSLAIFNGDVGGSADLTGNWTLTLTDTRTDGTNPPPYQLLDNWSLHFTSKDGKLTTHLGSDQVLTRPAPITGAASASTPYQQANTGPYGAAGVAPSISVAVDNSLGAYGQYEGRLYIAYTGGGGIDTNVFLASIDALGSLGQTANAAVKVNDDSVQDNFSEGNRSQFMPTVAVDPVTGTVGVMYYDGRWDPAHARVANSFSASLDGGAKFNPSTTLNTEKTAIDAITRKVVNLEPIPGNQGLAGSPFGFGDRQSLVMYAGRAVPLFTSNDNAAGQAIKSAQVTFGAGPRILSGDMGAIVTDAFTPFTGVAYNNTFAPDGTRQFTGFVITFDRPIDWSTFTANQIEIMYRDTVTTTNLPGVIIPNTDYTVTPLDAGAGFGLLGGARSSKLATTFFVHFKPGKERSAVGTYSYAVGNQVGAPQIRDLDETVTAAKNSTVGSLAATGNFMDQNLDAITGEIPGSQIVGTGLQIVDTNNTGFFGPPSTGTGTLTAKYQVNDILTVLGGTFSSAATIRVTAVDDVRGTFTGVPFSIYGAVLLSGGNYSAAPSGNLSVSGGGGSGATFTLNFFSGSVGDVFAVPTPVAAPGSPLSNAPFTLPYSQDTLPLIIPGPHLVGTGVTSNPNFKTTSTDNLVLNGTNNGVDVTFDRDINPATFTAGNVLRIVGPAGPITTYTLGPAVTFTGGGATTPATGVATIVNGFVTSVSITNPGAGYISAPTVVFSTLTGGTGATATATISGGKVTGVNVTSGGLGYTSASPITVPAGGSLDVPMTITDSLQVNDLSVGLSLAHGGPDSDLTASLVAPDGTTVVLFPGGPGSNLTKTVFDDNATESIANGNGPFTGIYRPLQGVTPASIAIATGGSGYLPNDLLTVVGGTFATPAQLKVTTVSAQKGPLSPLVKTGGTGYKIGDVLTVQGGTFTTAATIKVTHVAAGGVVDGATLLSAGAYSVAPTNPVSVTDATTPAATGATFNLAPAAINAGGTGYQVGDILTVSGGTFTTPATILVTHVTGVTGVIDGATLLSGGTYSAVPSGPVSVTDMTTPAAAGATFTLTYGVAGVSLLQAGSYSVQPFNSVIVTDGTPGSTASGATFNLSYGGLNTLNGKNYAGPWTLHLTNSGSTTATLSAWSLNPVTVTANPQVLDSATVFGGGTGYKVGDYITLQGGSFNVPAQLQVFSVDATTGAITAVSLVQPGMYSVAPSGTVGVTGGSGTGATFTTASSFVGTPNRTFHITLPTQSLSGTYSLQFGPDNKANYISDTLGHQIDTNLNAGVDLLRGGNPLNGSLVPNVYPSPAASSNLTLPASQTVNSVINVPDSYLVEGVTLQLSIQHQNDPDLSAVLIAPDGTQVQLFSRVGTTGSSPHANFTNTTFDDTARTPIQLASTLPNTGIGAGPFNPQLPLSLFKNHGSLGDWTLQIHSNSSTLTGTLVGWKLTLENSVAGSGLGEPVADQFNASFRIFTQDPTNSVAQQSWTAVGPASINNGGAAGRIGGLALDPSDPSGNTVYVAGASGAIWKSTNFLTTDPNGPTYVPLTDLGPGNSLNTGSITVFGRNSDPNQSIVIVSTGEGDTGTSGVGFLRSMDGGRNWRLLDSTTNVVTAANQKPGETVGDVLSINDARRDHAFVLTATSSFKVIVDPTAQPNGQVIVYAALSSGIWRSTDTGGTWTLLQGGVATDVVLSAGSAGANGNLQILYGAIEGRGVFYSTNAPTAASMSIRNGGNGVPLRRNTDNSPDTAIPVGNLGTPSGAYGRIVLAAPPLTGNALQDTLQEGWLYAAVSSTAGVFQGLYSTKDFGLNWTQIKLPVVQSTKGTALTQVSTNDDTMPDYSVDGSKKFPQANYNVSLAVDPNNPNVLYFGGTADANPVLNKQGGGFIRVDATALQDAYNEVAYDNSNNDGGLAQASSSGGVLVSKPSGGITTSQPGSPYLNLLRDPGSPFLTPSSLQFSGITSFTNSGGDATYGPFDGGGLGGTDQHRLVVFKDPLTGHTRVIFGDDQGVWTGTDNGSGRATGGIGGSTSVVGSRNGNLQITQFYDGATQPSTLAADIAGSLFYGVAQDDGFPRSDATVLDTGNIGWTDNTGGGDGSGVKVDQTGSGTAYYYKWPCCGAGPLPTDFFSVVDPNTGEVSRTTGLLLPGDDPYAGTGQWGFTGGSRFAVNPIDPTAVVMSSRLGRVFLTSGPTLGYGKQWFPIGDPSDLDGSYAPAMAFGAPADATAPLSNFIYAGTSGGKIFVTTTGGGVGVPWKNISAGLDGTAVQFIVTNPTRGSNEAYAVTSGGVFWMKDSSVANPKWVALTGNLFSASLSRTLFNDPSQAQATLTSLSSLQADWRYAIPDNLANPTGPTHPVLYAGGNGGVYRSLDKGVTWTYFPDLTIDGARQAGGLLPSVQVTDLALSLGNVNPVDGTASQTFGRNMLVATTYGRGVFAIRLDDQIRVPGGNPLYTYAVSAVAGPHVVSLAGIPSGAGIDGIQVNFSGPVDPATFSALKVNGVIDPLGNPVAVASIFDEGATNHNVYDIIFSAPDAALGFYHLSMGPNISDYSGNKMDQNQNFTNGENPADAYSGRFLYQPFTNNAPVLGTPTATVASVDEDQTAADPNGGPLAVINGMSVNSFLTGLPAPGITDADNNPSGYTTPAAPVGIAITGIDNTNGVWQYSLDGTNWTNIPAVSDTSALLLEGDTQPTATGQPAADRIRFLPNVDWSGTATFTFRAWDLTSGLTVYGADGLTADASVNAGGFAPTSAFSSATATATITVNFVNDQPSFNVSKTSLVANENTGLNTVLGFATGFNPGGAPDANESSQKVLRYNITVTKDTVTNDPTLSLFAVPPAIDPSTGTLTYTLNPNVSGTAKFDVAVVDDGGTANGGINTSATKTITLTVNFVNQKPSFVATAPAAVNEDDTAAKIVTFVTKFEASGGPITNANESGQTALAYTVVLGSVTNPGLFAALPTVDPTGKLHYTLKPNVSGTSDFKVTVRDSGGTANGGIDTSDPQTFTITVNFVNDQPSFIAANPLATNEDSGLVTVPGWVTKFEPSGGPVTDANELGQTALAYTVSFVSNTGGLSFTTGPTVDATTGNLTYTPAPNANGTYTFKVHVQDSGGVANNGVDTSADQTFTITVRPVNDAPSFTKGSDQTVLEDAGPQSVSLWATGISVGPANESSQNVSFVVQSITYSNTTFYASDAAFFLTKPTIDATGKLTYQTAANANGTATVTVVAKDDGGTANGGQDTSAPQTFKINVTPVNDAPSFVTGPNQVVVENTGAQSVPNWATGISAGPPDEAAVQTVSFPPPGDTNPSLFSVAPAIAANGTLSYTLAANAYGTATITATAKDTGGTLNNGSDTSIAHTFTITARQTDTVTVSSSSSAPTVGQSVTFSAIVAPTSAGTPTGTVTFTAGGLVLGTAPLMDNGSGMQVASVTSNLLPAGPNQTITASYSGDAGFAPNTGTMSQTVKAIGTTTKVVSSLNPSKSGQLVTFTATMTPDSGTLVNGTTVTFKNGSTVLGTVMINTVGGVTTASLTTDQLPAGNLTITATYNGDTTYGTSFGTVSQTVILARISSTALAVSPTSPTVFGQPVTLTATVTDLGTAPTVAPTGSVNFYDGSALIGTGTLVNVGGVMKASFVTPASAPLAAGVHSLTAVYQGNATFGSGNPTTPAIPFTVNQAQTTTTVTSSVTPSPYAQAITFTATVNATAPSVGSPTGTVTFMDGSTVLGTGSLSLVGGVMTATFSTASLAQPLTQGIHSITAVYGATASFNTSTSAAYSQTVTKPVPKVTISNTTNSVAKTGTFTAVYAPPAAAPGLPTPTGTVTFLFDGVAKETKSLDNTGLAAFVYFVPSGGGVTTKVVYHTLTAVYSGDATYAQTSTSMTVTYLVGRG